MFREVEVATYRSCNFNKQSLQNNLSVKVYDKGMVRSIELFGECQIDLHSPDMGARCPGARTGPAQNSTLPTFSRSNTTGILEDPCARILKNSSRI